VPPILGFVNGCKRREQDVKIRVCDSNVQRYCEADCRAKEHLCWANDGELEKFCRRETAVKLGDEFVVSCLLSKSLGLALQDDYRRGFVHEYERHDEECTGLMLLVSDYGMFKTPRTTIVTNQKFHRQPFATVKTKKLVSFADIKRQILTASDDGTNAWTNSYHKD
jgi:hypothetical protein